jgi:hypothetical protein
MISRRTTLATRSRQAGRPDFMARLIAQHLSANLGQIVVENRPRSLPREAPRWAALVRASGAKME